MAAPPLGLLFGFGRGPPFQVAWRRREQRQRRPDRHGYERESADVPLNFGCYFRRGLCVKQNSPFCRLVGFLVAFNQPFILVIRCRFNAAVRLDPLHLLAPGFLLRNRVSRQDRRPVLAPRVHQLVSAEVGGLLHAQTVRIDIRLSREAL